MIRRALWMVCGAFTLVTLLSSSPGASAAAREQPRTPVRIGWQVPAAAQAQLVEVLKRTNVMEAHGLEPRLVPFSFGAPQREAAIRGTLDVVFMGDQPAIDLIAEGGRWTIVARLFVDRIAIIVPRGSPIQEIGDLRGRSVASPFGSSAQREVMLQQEAAGLRPDRDVRNENLDILEIRRLVEAGGTRAWGDIDAVALWEPTASEFEIEGRARTVAARHTMGVIVFSDDFIADHPEAAVQLLAAVVRAWHYMAGHTDRVRQWYIDDAELGYTREALAAAARSDSNFRATAVTDVDLRLTDAHIADLERSVAWGKRWGDVADGFELRDAVDERWLAKAMAALAAHPQEDVEVILPSARETPSEDATDRYPFDALPLWVLFLVLMATSALAIEAGRWAGGWRQTEADRASDAVSTAVGAILALLAFVIALTFAAASTRFDARKQALLDEVNAIHTAYLRLDLLPEPHRTTTQSLLRDYVEVRLGLYRAYESPERLQLIRGRTEALQVSIWSHVMELAEVDRDSAIYALVAAGLNRVYDLHTTRVVLGAEYRIPLVVWYTLGLASWLAMAALGFHFGIGGRRSLRAGFAVSLMFALVILLVIELDRPGEGLIEVNQQPMRDLYHALSQ